MQKHLSVVIPAYNEVKNLRRGVLDSVYDYLKKQKYSWEVLVVDDESTDGTANLIQEFVKTHPGFRLLKEPHRGKGGTIIAGMLKAEGEIVLFSDMDQSTPIDQIDKLWPKFEKGYDIVIGSRHGRAGTDIIRKLMSMGLIVLRTVILNLPYKDTQCGFKAFRNETVKQIFERMRVFRSDKKTLGAAVNAGFDMELLFIARKLKLKVAEVPVEWYEYGQRKEVNPIKDSIDGIKELVQIRLSAISGKYRF